MGYYPLRNGGRAAALVRPVVARHTARKMADHGGARLTELTKQNTPIGPAPSAMESAVRRAKRKPGDLRRSFEQKAVVALPGNRYQSGVETHDPIAPFVEWPTRPHEILPRRRGGLLAFVKDGHWVYTKRVWHPGTTGQAMVRISAAKVEAELREGLLEPELREWKRLSELGL